MHLDLTTSAVDLSSALPAAGLSTRIGFTVSLFIAGLAYDPAMRDAAKVGILAASVASVAAAQDDRPSPERPHEAMSRKLLSINMLTRARSTKRSAMWIGRWLPM